MLKKLFVSVIAALLVCMFSTVAFADTIITITRPEGDESTFKKTYMVCGFTDKKDVTVGVSVYDNALGEYIPLYTTEEESNWTVGSSGMFMKEVKLPNVGANKIRVMAYRDSSPENVQINDFTITVLNESLKDKIFNNFLNIKELISPKSSF